MRPITVLLLIGLLFLLPPANQGRAEVNAGISFDNDGIKGFYLAIGEHYQVPEKQIIAIREKSISDDEMPVVFYLARRAMVSPGTIIKMRLGGQSWMDITFHYGLTAEIFYVPVTVDPGPPYGKAYGYFKKNKRNQWGSIKLNDVDVVNLVNLKFISDYYNCPADDVIKMRQNGKKFVDINTEVKKNKQKKKEQSVKRADQGPEKKKGKGKK